MLQASRMSSRSPDSTFDHDRDSPGTPRKNIDVVSETQEVGFEDGKVLFKEENRADQGSETVKFATPAAGSAPSTPFSSARAQRHLRMLEALRSSELENPPLSTPVKTPLSQLGRILLTQDTSPSSAAGAAALSASLLLVTPSAPPASKKSFAAPTLPELGPSTPQTINAPPSSPLGRLPPPATDHKYQPPAEPSTEGDERRRLSKTSLLARIQGTTAEAGGHLTPKRDPRELRGGRGDLSELRRRGIVKHAGVPFGKSVRDTAAANPTPMKVGFLIQCNSMDCATICFPYQMNSIFACSVAC
ncbi:hypothetical protein DFJ77DRAFT_107237 [Powellomyces hirtus]|nr:hypothetical protein DFJ77DRAFT_107237 [Powellomyces hirtus]